MYWIYLVIFILVILTPRFITGGWQFLREEDIESMLIFFLDTFGFMIYLAKEKALLRVFREKLHLQKQTNIITRDLSDSYSYIGEMNRKLDIVKELIFQLPQTTAEIFSKKSGSVYSSLLATASLLSKSDQVFLCFVETKRKMVRGVFCKDKRTSWPPALAPLTLLATGKYFWEEAEHIIVRSPRPAKGVAAFLVFAKTKNHVDDGEVFKIVVSEALLLYCVEQELGNVEKEK